MSPYGPGVSEKTRTIRAHFAESPFGAASPREPGQAVTGGGLFFQLFQTIAQLLMFDLPFHPGRAQIIDDLAWSLTCEIVVGQALLLCLDVFGEAFDFLGQPRH